MGEAPQARTKATDSVPPEDPRERPTDPAHVDHPDDPAEVPLPRYNRWLTVGLPALVGLLLLALCYLVAGRRVALEVLTAAGACLFGLGTTVIFGPAVLPGIHLSTWNLALVVAVVNTLSAWVYAFNLDLLERVPRMGDVLHRARVRARASLREHPWIRRLATAGVTLFVITPLPGSGSLGGSIVGLLLGLGALRTFLAVTLAGLAVSYAYAVGGSTLAGWLDARDVGIPLRVGAVLVTLFLFFLLARWVRRLAQS